MVHNQPTSSTEETLVKPTTIVIALSLSAIAAGVTAQQTGFKRTVLQQVDLSVPGREAVTAVAELQPGASAGRHTHPGEEIGYVIEGSVLVERDGMPPLTAKAGEAFLIPSGKIHNATNKGTTAARILATYIIEKGKPVATPAATK
jgi:quercetin dioxygenase-like cupin family protein